MSVLVDTSLLGRLANTSDLAHGVAQTAVSYLHRRGERLCLTAQNLVEFHNFATRPRSNNGLGISPSAALKMARIFELRFDLLDEIPEIYPAWRALVETLEIKGKQVHDARLAAVCHVHGVSHLLTFNIKHFSRFTSAQPRLVVMDPADLCKD